MRFSGSRARLAGVVVVVVTVTALVVAGGVVARGAPGSVAASGAGSAGVAAPDAGPGPGSVRVSPAVGSLAVLRAWDRARSRAWARGDPRALARLYVPGSAAGRRDLAMLRAWTGRGLRVEGMTTQVLAVRLRAWTPRRLVLVVTDRLDGGFAVPPSGVGTTGPARRALPRDGPSTSRLVFRRVAGRWLLSSAQPRASPVASTASTSGSANS
ncbi:hypothetical protein [Pimelobacter sp. 30-1]|uniref:hypothetical protein n=1 Tax=Pimelobacter sp. 30-1 TaxID=2004991 RepID=UPI001C04AEEF|nr:hypothetical protein [Pimelobacter sp. 30-1]MBU2697535.1 hypothetical protein [Pimelobacter sp. 30-1]